MSIDARIDLVTYEADGTATLWLVDRDKQSCAGQRQLTVVNPKANMDAMEGLCIWGSASTIMVGDTVFAKRLSYTTIELVKREVTHD